MLLQVTVTGADNNTDIDKLLAIAEKYPFVEFGILMSQSQANSPRFPDIAWIDCLLAAAKGTRMECSGHFCGNFVRKILLGDESDSDFNKFFNKLRTSGVFHRYQLNTHGRQHAFSGKFLDLITTLATDGQAFIMQQNNRNNELIAAATKFPNVDVLFDLSHGTGVLPDAWPIGLKKTYCGYAGGLSPENVAEQIKQVLEVVDGHPFWIDAETWLRGLKTDTFDLLKVSDFLAAAEPFFAK